MSMPGRVGCDTRIGNVEDTRGRLGNDHTSGGADEPSGGRSRMLRFVPPTSVLGAVASRRRLLIVVGLAAGLAAASVVVLRSLFDGTRGFRRALPETATDVHEDAWEDGFLPDYHYCLKAKISAVELEAYARRLELAPPPPAPTPSAATSSRARPNPRGGIRRAARPTARGRGRAETPGPWRRMPAATCT